MQREEHTGRPVYLETVYRQQATNDAFLEARAQHDGVVFLVHTAAIVTKRDQRERWIPSAWDDQLQRWRKR
jgi:hypothetical protein